MTEGRELIKELITTRDPRLAYIRKLTNVNDKDDVGSFINNVLDELWMYILPFQIQTRGNKRSLPIW